MSAGRRNIVIEKGATFQYNLIWKDSNSVPINLTGYSARMQCRKTINSDTPFLSLTSSDGDITLGGSLGTIAVVGSATDTAAIDDNIKVGVYDLEIESASGVVTRLVEGQVEVRAEVTR
jgi:hypothetical protein